MARCRTQASASPRLSPGAPSPMSPAAPTCAAQSRSQEHRETRGIETPVSRLGRAGSCSRCVVEHRAIGHLGVKIEAYLLRVDGPWIATCRRRDEQGQNRWPDGDKTAFDKIPCHLPAKAPGREKQF